MQLCMCGFTVKLNYSFFFLPPHTLKQNKYHYYSTSLHKCYTQDYNAVEVHRSPDDMATKEMHSGTSASTLFVVLGRTANFLDFS